MAVALPAGVKEVQRINAPGGGYYVLGSDGGVFAISDEQGRTPQFYGSMPGLQGDTLAGQHQFDANSLTAVPGGGYSVMDTAGRKYTFDTNQARAMGLNVSEASNPLYQDPAFQAFVRTSGLGLDIASADTEREIAAKNRAYTARVSDLTDPNFGSIAQGRKTMAGGFEDRGLSRSGERDTALTGYDVAQGKSLSDLAAGHTEEVAGLQSGLSGKIAGEAAKGAELGLDVGTNQEYQTGLAQLKKRYPSAYGAQ